jgi:hypothetical protein
MELPVSALKRGVNASLAGRDRQFPPARLIPLGQDIPVFLTAANKQGKNEGEKLTHLSYLPALSVFPTIPLVSI